MNAFHHARAIERKSCLCEWDPVTDSPAMALQNKYLGCGKPHTVVVGTGNNALLLCENCAALPRFKRRKKRRIPSIGDGS